MDPAPYGGNLSLAIGAAVASCDVLVLMIGPHWMSVTGEGLHDPNDYVRLAMEAALARGILVIPVTVDGARMPVHGELPPSLASMAGQPAFQLSMSNFDAESGQLRQVLDQSITERQSTQLAPSPGASAFPGRQAAATPVPAPLPFSTKPLPPKRRFGKGAIIGAVAGVVVIAAAAFFVFQTPGGHPAATGVRVVVVGGLPGVLAARQHRAQAHDLGLLGRRERDPHGRLLEPGDRLDR